MQERLYINMENNIVLFNFTHKINGIMLRLENYTQQKTRQIGIQYFDWHFCTLKKFLLQTFWPRILKFSLAFSINASLIPSLMIRYAPALVDLTIS